MAEALITAAEEAASRLTETAEEGRATAAGASLHATSLDQLTGDMVALVWRYPVASALIGLGVGVSAPPQPRESPAHLGCVPGHRWA